MCTYICTFLKGTILNATPRIGAMLCLGGVVILRTQSRKENIRALLVVNPPVPRVKNGCFGLVQNI